MKQVCYNCKQKENLIKVRHKGKLKMMCDSCLSGYRIYLEEKKLTQKI
jgi:hypothetical protein